MPFNINITLLNGWWIGQDFITGPFATSCEAQNVIDIFEAEDKAEDRECLYEIIEV